MKECGIIIKQMGKEYYGILMEIDFKDNLKIKKLMVMDVIFTIMGSFTVEIG